MQGLRTSCNYSRETGFARRFAGEGCLGEDASLKVPWVWNGSTERVLVVEHVRGVSFGGPTISRLSQEDHN